MKILILTDVFPTPEFPHAACFLNERLKICRKLGVDFDVYSLVVRESLALKMCRKFLGRLEAPHYGSYVFNDGVKYNFIYFKQDFFDKLLSPNNHIELMELALLEAIDIKSYDMILIHFVYPLVMLARKISATKGIPYAFIAHGSDVHTFPFKFPNQKTIFIDSLEMAQAGVFVSKGLLNKAKELGYSGANAHVIPNGVNTAIFKPVEKQFAKKAINILSDKKCVGFVGNLIPVKRADKLIEIFSLIKQKFNSEIFFLVVGDGYLRSQIEYEAKHAGIDIEMSGNLPQKALPLLMSAMDLMILPSRNEGWGCVILEANACGTPVVGSDNGGIPEAIGNDFLIVPDGENFEIRFAEKVVSILKNSIDQSRLISRVAEYSWEKTAEQEVDLFLSCITSNKRYLNDCHN